MPYALKDIIDVAGLPTTAHSKILADSVAAADAPVTARLKAAGGVLLGKLSTHEFAIGGPSFDLPWPPARNPWNREHFPGGSSSGSGAGLAAGFFPAALGSDTGGSIRNPASQCGITGMKPTYGRVSRRGVVPLAFSLDHIGPMTRGVRDNALMLQAIAGHDPADPASADEPVPDVSAALGQGVKGLKIGVIRHFYTSDLEGHPEMIAAIDAAVALLAGQGAEVREITLPPLQDFSACGQVILAAEAYAVHEQWLQEKPQDYGARARERLLAGATIRAVDYVQALRWRLKLRDQVAAAFAGVDVAITASSMDPACRIDDDEALAANYWRQARMPFNVTGQPGLVIPAGFSSGGLPLSLQLVGRPFTEPMLYRVGQFYEDVTGWTKRHPAALTD
jgi:aspartyl-tRNA(Asn)/glutamyl-tRNA(Gln) amidotransferase subunit A